MLCKITKRTVDAAKPGDANRFLWDTELKGFGVKVTPAGQRVYVLQYRKGGRGTPTRRVTIGRHGAVTPEQARKIASRLTSIVAEGGDPAAARAAEKGAPTVAKLAKRFDDEHIKTKTKAKTAVEYRRLIKTIIKELGKRRVRDITRADIARLHHEHRAAPYVANRLLAVLSKMFTLAEEWGERPDGSNPCRHVRKYKEHKRERFLSEAELARLGEALSSFDGSPYAVAAIKLLAFTGARLSEVLGLRWEWIDIDRGEARLPDSKTGAKTLHLPPPALEVLAALPRVEDNPYVIVGHVGGCCLVNPQKPWRAIRKAAQLEGVRLHDLRHAFASVAAGSGMSLPIIGKMLGHSQPATTARYAHLASDPVKAAAAAVASKIEAAMKGGSGQVVPLRQ
jgi:integrase